jgi:hypothetical protein
MKRREFIYGLAAMPLLLCNIRGAKASIPAENFSPTFDIIIENAKYGNWKDLSIGEIIGNVAFELLGTPYEGGTLEINETEKCVVNLNSLDCVTFFETALGLARIIKLEKYSFDALIEQITFLRYRGGKINGYTSRLHYTSDWIYDNVKKGAVIDITKTIGGKKIRFNLSFMSKHPQYYKQLKNNPGNIEQIRAIEESINARTYYYIPKGEVKTIEFYLRTGDIIAIVNTNKGLDYSHTGLIYRGDNIARFMHASSLKKKVILDKSISEYLKHSKKSNKGITVLRPLEPKDAE